MSQPNHVFESSSGGGWRRSGDKARRTLLEQHSVVALSCDACKTAFVDALSCVAPCDGHAWLQQAAPGCTSDTCAMPCETSTLPA